MPVAVNALEQLNFGLESASGTLVATDTALPALEGGQFTINTKVDPINDNHGVRAAVEDRITRRESLLTIPQVLDFDNVILPFQCGLVAVTASGDPDVWTYTPDVTTVEAIDTATFDVRYTDAASDHLEREFGYAVCSGYEITGGIESLSRITSNWFGRHAQSSTFSDQSGLTRVTVPGSAWSLYIDSSWANLGNTQVTNYMRAFTFRVDTGKRPDFTGDGRSDLDMTGILHGPLAGSLSLTARFTGDAATELAAFEAGTLRFISLEVAGSGSRSMKLQGCFRYLTVPRFPVQDGMRMIEMQGMLRQDPTSANVLSHEITNGLAAL